MPSQPATTIPVNKLSRIYAVIKQSLNGETVDYTQGSIRKAVILLAIPMVLEMCMESVFAVVDIFFVSHLGKHATSIVGLTESVITIVYSLAIGISMAATAMVARRIGEKDPAAATKAGMQSIFVALVVTMAVSIPGFIFAPQILRLMGAEEAAIQSGVGIHAYYYGRKPGHHAVVSYQWYFPRRRQCHDGHEKFMACQYLQYYFMPPVDTRSWPDTGFWIAGRSNGHHHWP